MLGGVRVPHDRGVRRAFRRRRGASTRCATRCSARWRWATSASISRRATRSGRAPTAARSCAIAARCSREHGWTLGNADITVICERPEGRPARARRCARADRRRPRRRRRRDQRQGDHHRDARLHRPRRRHRRAGGRACCVRAVSDAAARATARRVLRRAHARRRRRISSSRSSTASKPSGAGEHLLLTIEKRGMNTAFAAKRLAQWAGIAEMGVGYAGLKDRHAVTRQRFSVHLPKKVAPDLAALRIRTTCACSHSTWHARKLPRGALAGNRFVLVLREVQGERDGDRGSACARSPTRGVPNYFGEQRFGRDGDNVDAGAGACSPAAACSASSARCCCRRRARSCSTACWPRASRDGTLGSRRSTARCGCWTARRSVFGPGAVRRRAGARGWRPSTSIRPGRCGARASCAPPARRARWKQRRSMTRNRRALRAGLEAAGLKQERRALRLRPQAMAWEWPAHDVLRLTFELPPGSYATTVVGQFGEIN